LVHFSDEQNFSTTDISHTFLWECDEIWQLLGLANRSLFPEFRELWSGGPETPCGDMHQSFIGILVKSVFDKFLVFADTFSVLSIHCVAWGLGATFLHKCTASRGGSVYGWLVGWSLTSPFSTNTLYGYIRDEGSVHSSQQRVAILYNGRRPLSRFKIAPSSGGIWTSSSTLLLEPIQVLNPNGISIGSAVFAGLTSVTINLLSRNFAPIVNVLLSADLSINLCQISYW